MDINFQFVLLDLKYLLYYIWDENYINYWYIVVKQILYLDVGTYTLDLANWEYYLNNDNNNSSSLIFIQIWLQLTQDFFFITYFKSNGIELNKSFNINAEGFILLIFVSSIYFQPWTPPHIVKLLTDFFNL